MIRLAVTGPSLCALALSLLLACDSGQGVPKPSSQRTHVTRAEEQLQRFRQGERFKEAGTTFLVEGKPDPQALGTFIEALRVEKEPVREQAARALVTTGYAADPLHQAGVRLLRDERIVSALIEHGLSKQGPTRDYVLQVLQESVPAGLLQAHGVRLVEALRQPSNELLLIIAKAKIPEARPTVEALAGVQEWAGSEELEIARAALGDTALQQRYIDAFLKEKDPEKKAQLAGPLGWIGTQAALRALASEMRTPLVIEVPMALRRSVRLDVMAALSYNYPDKLILYDNAIQDDEGYARVERFCEETFGIQWKTPRPPFLTVEGFPAGHVEP